MILDTRIQGIPCRVLVTYYRKEDSPILTGPMDWADPGSPVEIEFRVLNLRGARAVWLERKMTSADRAVIEQQIIAAFEQERADAQEALAEGGCY
ncbi:MAG: hypothetical protein J0I30_06355 [Burkholderiales bacterium]|nr:hypothetical protein [Burkholderiales bacterium]